MWGLSGVAQIVRGGKKLQIMELTEKPNMIFLYLLAVLGALFKPRWTASKTFPALEVHAGGRL